LIEVVFFHRVFFNIREVVKKEIFINGVIMVIVIIIVIIFAIGSISGSGGGNGSIKNDRFFFGIDFFE
jgi:hypothetical protein